MSLLTPLFLSYDAVESFDHTCVSFEVLPPNDATLRSTVIERVKLRQKAIKDYREPASRRRRPATYQPTNVSIARKQKAMSFHPTMDSIDRLKTGFAALPEELRLEIYRWNANRMVLNTVPGIKHVRWVATAYNSGITGVSREIQQAAGDTLYALDREKEARLFVHWKGIKQLPRLLQLLAHTYTWGKRWLEANPPNATDGQQDWVRVKKSTSHDLNALLYEYLNPSHYKGIFNELGDPSRSPTLSALIRDWFSDIATKCNTAAPIPLSTAERRLLIEFLEMTMDKLRNPSTSGDVEIYITVPTVDATYADPDDQTRALYLDDVVEYMYQLFETFRTHFRIKFRLVAVLNTPADELIWTLVGEDYAKFIEPCYNVVQGEGTGEFEVTFSSIMRVDHEALDMA